MSLFKGLAVALLVVSGLAVADGYEVEGDAPIRPVYSSGEAKAPSITTLSGPEMAPAVAHYGRARALLLSAITEFDRGLKVARPDQIFDPKSFRSGLVERATDLERLLAPQARITKTGVKLEGDARVLKTEADRK